MTERQTALQKIANVYEDSPIIRTLVQIPMALVPYGIGSAIDVALTSAIENMREERLRIFFDELVTGSRYLTEELIQEEDFLHAYFSTLKAAVNTRRRDKIKLFARLLISASQERRLGSDVFEEFLNILDELSVRELQVLIILKRFEDAHPHEVKVTEGAEAEPETDLQRANRFWDSFKSDVEVECGVHPDQLSAFLTRLNRTGLYETFAGTYWNYEGGKGKLTPMFAEFVRWLRAEEEDFTKHPAGAHAPPAPERDRPSQLDTTAPGVARREVDFWEGASVAELARIQGVSPVQKLEDLYGDFWPEEESIDDFISTVRQWRHEDLDEQGSP